MNNTNNDVYQILLFHYTLLLQEAVSRMRATLESSTDGILVVDMQGKILDYNNKFATLWRIKKTTLDKQDFNVVVNALLNELNDPEKFLRKVKELRANPEAVCVDILKTKNRCIFEFYSQPQYLNGKIIGRVWSFRDITQRAVLEEKLQFQATHDTLTSLPNRTLLNDRLQQNIAHGQRHKTQFAVLFFDLDHFKLINDTLTHAYGDELLCAIADRMQASIRASDTLARIGGDEFVIVLTDMPDKDTIANVATKLLSTIASPYSVSGREIAITTSMGVSIFPKDGSKPETLISNADTAMYYAKKYGANQFKFYHEKMNEDNIKFLEQETLLHEALAKNEFVLCYQPQVDLTTENLVAVEALVRWNHPKKGLILPKEFIQLAEETGLIIPIGEWVLKTACTQNKAWQTAGLPPIRVAVNVSAQQLHQYNFVKTVVDILEETGLAPEYLELELTESTFINNPSSIQTIHALKEIGVRIALDDFGTGYSSLTSLRNIPIDRLNIDRSFVQNIQVVHGDEAILEAIITMARNLNLEVLAEGVETEKQLAFLKSQQCGEIQGFYFSKALTPTELERLLKDKSEINKIIERANH